MPQPAALHLVNQVVAHRLLRRTICWSARVRRGTRGARGYRGVGSLRTCLQALRVDGAAAPTAARIPKVRAITTWLLRHPDKLHSDDRARLAGLRRDHDAVLAGLTLPHNSGPVEGHVNRIILWNQSWSMSGVFRR